LTTDVLLSLGSNMGDRKALVDAAVARLGRLPGTEVRARSSYYRTEPVGPVQQEWFLNIGVSLETEQSRGDLSAACRAIEAELGRDRSQEISWGPRPIDIDVVKYGDAALLDERAFVVVPLAEIAANLTTGGDTSGVTRLDWPVPPIG